MKRIKEGEIFSGVVKNLTEYGAFVDLGGVDGLLHVTDIAWERVNHPSDRLSVGQQVTVQVIRFNSETRRISLGMKQLEADPWRGVAERFPVGARFKGRVSNTTDYGAFVQLEPGIEGLVHVSEMSWAHRNVHPKKTLSISQEVEVMVLEIDEKRRRISLGIKQTRPNPWRVFADEHPTGTVVSGPVRNITSFGLFIKLNEEIDGMIHIDDLSWEKAGAQAVKDFAKGDEITASVLSVDVERGRIALGVKQLQADPGSSLPAGATVTCRVVKTASAGIEVAVSEGEEELKGFIKRGELSRHRGEQQPDRFAPGEKVDAKVLSFDPGERRLLLSIRRLQDEEQEAVVKEYGSAESGAQLGEILGAGARALLGGQEGGQEEGGESGTEDLASGGEDAAAAGGEAGSDESTAAADASEAGAKKASKAETDAGESDSGGEEGGKEAE